MLHQFGLAKEIQEGIEHLHWVAVVEQELLF